MNKKTLDAITSLVYVSRQVLNGNTITEDDQKIRASGLYEDWAPGAVHEVGDVRNAGGQTWECFQGHDAAIYPDISPEGAAWRTFWRPLHGKTPETARPFVEVQGAHDTYKVSEFICPDFAAIAAELSEENESEEIDMSKDEVKALIRETVKEVLDEENPVYKDLKDVPEYWRPTAAALLDAGAVNGGTPAEVCATDLNLRKETLKAVVVATAYHNARERTAAEK